MAADQNQPLGGSSPDVGAWPGVAGTVDMGRALFRGIGMNPYILWFTGDMMWIN